MVFSSLYERILKHKTVAFLANTYMFKVEYEYISLLFLVFYITRFEQVALCVAMNFTNTITEGIWSIKKLKNVGLKTWKTRIESCHTQKYDKLNYFTTEMSYNHTFSASICPQLMIIMTWFSNSFSSFFLFFQENDFFLAKNCPKLVFMIVFDELLFWHIFETQSLIETQLRINFILSLENNDFFWLFLKYWKGFSTAKLLT